MTQRRQARHSDWKTQPLPEHHTRIQLDRRYSPDELARIQLGVIPQQMEDKWFVYWGDNQLFFHRSWTGLCMYVVDFELDGTGARMVSARVNRDPAQYGCTDDQRDADEISFLVDVLLLKMPARSLSFAQRAGIGPVGLWKLIGRAMVGQYPGDPREPTIVMRSKCHLCRHKFRGHKGCAAFPIGLPHDLAIGNVLHDEEYPGDRGYRFEERDRSGGDCSQTYKGKDVEIPINDIISLADRCKYGCEPSVHRSYQEFIRFFEDRDPISDSDVIYGASMVYSWMPTTLEFKNLDHFAELAEYLNAVRKGNDLDAQTLHLFKSVINNSLIGTSKLLHVVAPESYPIVDSHIADFLKVHGQLVNTDDPEWYVAYTCACRRAATDERFGRVHQKVNNGVGFEVSALRALEFVMFLAGRGQCR